MPCPLMTIRLAIAFAVSVGPPGTLFAQQYQFQAPAYTAPTPNAEGNDALDSVMAAPQPDAPTAPDLTFRDRLLKLNGGVAATKANPGFTTSDTTSSYSTSPTPGAMTGDTTSSYSTVPDPQNGTDPNPVR